MIGPSAFLPRFLRSQFPELTFEEFHESLPLAVGSIPGVRHLTTYFDGEESLNGVWLVLANGGHMVVAMCCHKDLAFDALVPVCDAWFDDMTLELDPRYLPVEGTFELSGAGLRFRVPGTNWFRHLPDDDDQLPHVADFEHLGADGWASASDLPPDVLARWDDWEKEFLDYLQSQTNGLETVSDTMIEVPNASRARLVILEASVDGTTQRTLALFLSTARRAVSVTGTCRTEEGCQDVEALIRSVELLPPSNPTLG